MLKPNSGEWSSWVGVLPQYGLLPWFMRLAGSLAGDSKFASCSIASIAQVPDFQQALVQGFNENDRASLCVVPETRNAEDDVVWLWVVTGAITVGHYWAIAAEHFHSGRNLESRPHNYNHHHNNTTFYL